MTKAKPKARSRPARGAEQIVVHEIRERIKAFDTQNSDYRASLDAADPQNRFMRRRDGLGGIGDSHIPESKLWYVRETSRHMCLNDDLPGQMLSRLTDNVIQDVGFRLVSQTGDDGLDEEIENRNDEWAGNPLLCDFYGERTFREMEWILFFQTAMDGDMFGLFIDDGTVQLVEADRCTTRRPSDPVKTHNGLDFDASGKVLAYNFTKTPGGPYTYMSSVEDTRRIAARDSEGLRQVVHSYDPRRITQHRGYPWLTPLMIKAGMLDDLQFAIIVKAQSAAAHAGIIERPVGTPNGPVTFGPRSTVTGSTAVGGVTTDVLESIKYGQHTVLPAGYKLNAFTPTIPNAEHFQHVRATIQQIGAGVNMPIAMVLLDGNNENFSGMRGIMELARMSFRRWQNGQASRFNHHAHKMNVRRWASQMGAVARRALADGSIYRHKWVPPAWPYINPKEDAEAAGLMISKGLDSPRGIVAKRGGDFTDVYTETITDRSSAIRAAITESQSIKKDTGVTVSYQEVLGWDLPANTTLVAAADENENLNSGNGTESQTPAPGTPTPPKQEPTDESD